MSDCSRAWPFLGLLLFLLQKELCHSAATDATTPTGSSSFQRIYQTEQTLRNAKGKEMRSHMNLSVDPCTDFYEYACGGWQAAAGPLLQLHQRTDVDLLRLLEETAHREDSGVARQAKEFYKSCLVAQAQQSQQQQQFLSELIQQNGGFPAVPGSNWEVHHHDYDWLKVLGELRRRYGLDILIGLRIGYNYENVHENSIYLSEPSTLIPRKLCTQNRLDIRDMAYEPLERRVAAELKAWLAVSNDAAARLAADILSFEHELCGGMMQDFSDSPWDAEQQLYAGNYTRKTLANFSKLYELNLESYVTASYGKVIFKPVYMAAPKYYRQLQRTVAAHNSSQVANYIMYRALSAVTFPLEDRTHLRRNVCLGLIKQHLPTALGELYARQFASEDARKDLETLYGQLQDALKQSLSAEWLEEGSRRVAQRKLSDLKLHLPHYERPLTYKLQLERNNYWSNLRQLLGAVQEQQMGRLFEEELPAPSDPVEAYEARVRYRPVQRQIDIGLGLLQAPFYDPHYGQSLRYATLGVAVARQMAMAFDDPHWSVDLLERDHWDGLTAWRYHDRSECFSRQVEEYLHANVSATRQLIADSAALNVAFRAYLTWLGFKEPNNDFNLLSKETLPGLNYSNTALFFVAYAQQHCSREESNRWSSSWAKELPAYSAQQNHTWPRLQVNGPLRNLEDFAKEFHCPMGSAMNPATKCNIY
ncbi:endothelin-converting enzyme homolog [Drosophila guanche]|uniref:Blast:Endothelin-converting enzyme-like 1 n=1 Tax=Drosophila guanche TaxID=7266 RepID=A0A3B0KH57_DROGU|nr:endothelin-converting enzyme homolog [Drosophila guanche]SPP83008.1 blast:Endothelin-converting enzyme-like 1 [Drosophila guanche]